MIFKMALLNQFPVCLPPKMISKAISNIFANAVAYTIPGGTISVYFDNRNLVIENECLPIPSEHLKKFLSPFIVQIMPEIKKTAEMVLAYIS